LIADFVQPQLQRLSITQPHTPNVWFSHDELVTHSHFPPHFNYPLKHTTPHSSQQPTSHSQQHTTHTPDAPSKPTISTSHKPPRIKGDLRDVHPVFAAVSTQTRGKERETPKRKKLSTTKKIVLKEKQEKREKEQSINANHPSSETDQNKDTINKELETISQKEENQQPSNPLPRQAFTPTPPHLRLPHFLPSKEVTLPPTLSLPSLPSSVLTPYLPDSTQSPSVSTQQITTTTQIRPYITHTLSPEIDSLAYEFITSLHQFEINKKKALGKNTLKFKKRLVAGLKEVAKKLSVNKLKFVIASPNIQEITSEGGLNDQVGAIVRACNAQEVPLAFALSRKKLGTAVGRNIRISIIGVIYYDGADELYSRLAELVRRAVVCNDSNDHTPAARI